MSALRSRCVNYTKPVSNGEAKQQPSQATGVILDQQLYWFSQEIEVCCSTAQMTQLQLPGVRWLGVPIERRFCRHQNLVAGSVATHTWNTDGQNGSITRGGAFSYLSPHVLHYVLQINRFFGNPRVVNHPNKFGNRFCPRILLGLALSTWRFRCLQSHKYLRACF